MSWKIVKARIEEAGLSEVALLESREALVQARYIELHHAGGGIVMHYELTRLGYTAGIRTVIPDFDDVRQKVIAILVNDPPTSEQIIDELAKRVDTPPRVVDMILKDLETRELIHVVRALARTELLQVSPTLSRQLH